MSESVPMYAEEAPDDAAGLAFPCPTCGMTRLAGMLYADKGWLVCTQCRLCIPDKPGVRRMMSAFTDA